jgi:endonuclease/exonuclease/phosphatase family metal-dependent hydrolase
MLRAMTLNLWGEQPPLERRLELVVAGVSDLRPDVLALQEVREVPGVLPNVAATLASRLGCHHVFCPATEWGGGVEGVAILSRRPILASESAELPGATPQERRVVLMARCETDAGPLQVATTHLNYRLHDGLTREAQVQAVDAFIAARPSELPQLLMGDFNATPAHDEIRFLRGCTTLGGRRTYYQDAFEQLHPDEPGITWARRNPYTEKLRWLEPERRLDYIFVTPMRRDGRGAVRSCRIVLDEPESDGAFASDHFGLYAEVQVTADGAAAP